VTPSVAAPSDTNPSDATVAASLLVTLHLTKNQLRLSYKNRTNSNQNSSKGNVCERVESHE